MFVAGSITAGLTLILGVLYVSSGVIVHKVPYKSVFLQSHSFIGFAGRELEFSA